MDPCSVAAMQIVDLTLLAQSIISSGHRSLSLSMNENGHLFTSPFPWALPPAMMNDLPFFQQQMAQNYGMPIPSSSSFLFNMDSTTPPSPSSQMPSRSDTHTSRGSDGQADDVNVLKILSASPDEKGAVGPIRTSSVCLKSKDERKEKFDEVPGRLCLLSGCTKYKVTVGEIMRRMAYPETLHASLISGILRKAKEKDGSKVLRNVLAKHNLELPFGRRKTAKTTGFTSLCEGEAVRLATDFNRICVENGGSTRLGKHLTSQALALRRHANDFSRDLKGFLSIISMIEEIYAKIPELPDEIEPENELEEAINHFSMLTHGFGHNAMRGVFEHLRNTATEAFRCCTGRTIDSRQDNMLLLGLSAPPSDWKSNSTHHPALFDRD